MARHKKSRKKGKKLSAGQLKNEIAKLFKRSPRKRLNSKQIIKKLKIANNRDSVQDALNKLTEENKLVPVGDYKYRVNTKAVASAAASTHIAMCKL